MYARMGLCHQLFILIAVVGTVKAVVVNRCSSFPPASAGGKVPLDEKLIFPKTYSIYFVLSDFVANTNVEFAERNVEFFGMRALVVFWIYVRWYNFLSHVHLSRACWLDKRISKFKASRNVCNVSSVRLSHSGFMQEQDYRVVCTGWDVTIMCTIDDPMKYWPIYIQKTHGRGRQSRNGSSFFAKSPLGAILYNSTDDSCSVVNKNNLFSLPVSLVYWAVGTEEPSSSADFISKVVEFSKKNPGYLVDTVTQSGIGGVEWLLCANNTSPNATDGFELSVVFAGDGDGSIQPPSKIYKNPLPLAISVKHFANISNANETADQHVMMSFTKFSDPAEKDTIFDVPGHVVCDGLQPVPVNVTLPSDFKATVHVGGQPNDLNVLFTYRSSSSLVIVEGTPVNGTMAVVNDEHIAPSASILVHNFATGYSHSLSSDGRCLATVTLSNSTSDVQVDAEVLTMKSAVSLFVPQNVNWSQYDNEESVDGVLSVFRARISATDKVALRMLGSRLYDVTVYKNSSMLSYFHLLSLPEGPLPDISSCYNHASAATFSVEFKDRPISSISPVFPYLTAAIAKAIDAITPVNPSRIRCAFVPTASSSAVIVSIAPALNVPHAQVKDLKNETSELEVLRKVNETLLTSGWKISFNDAEGKTQEWSVSSGPVGVFPPPPPPPHFEGYTGGSMFVLAVFMLIVGAGVGAGGLFFVTRRQRISTLAYQVFE